MPGVRGTRIGACFPPASPVPHQPLPYSVESDSLPNLLGRESLSTSFRFVRYAPFCRYWVWCCGVRGNDGLSLDAAAAREAAGGAGAAQGSAARRGVGGAVRVG